MVEKLLGGLANLNENGWQIITHPKYGEEGWHQFRAKNSFGDYHIEAYEYTYTANGTIRHSKKVGN